MQTFYTPASRLKSAACMGKGVQYSTVIPGLINLILLRYLNATTVFSPPLPNKHKINIFILISKGMRTFIKHFWKAIYIFAKPTTPIIFFN